MRNLSGSMRAYGRIRGVIVHRILPGTRILPDLPDLSGLGELVTLGELVALRELVALGEGGELLELIAQVG
jgi:hypothetical protein